MTQRIDGTNTIAGMRVRRTDSRDVYWMDASVRQDDTTVVLEEGELPRMILARAGELPEAPAWANSFRVWHKDGWSSLWLSISENSYPGWRVAYGGDGFKRLGVEFSGKDYKELRTC